MTDTIIRKQRYSVTGLKMQVCSPETIGLRPFNSFLSKKFDSAVANVSSQ